MGLDIYVKSRKNKKNDSDITNWRKVNFVMGYLAEHDFHTEEFNCFDVLLKSELTLELLERCNKILKAKNENENWIELAEKTLPTYPGFFFGSYDYDEWYLEDLELVIHTIKELYEKYGTYDILLHIWY